MTRTIQVIRKKSEAKNLSDPLQRQKLAWTIGHVLTLGCGVLFSVTYFFHVLLFFKYRSWKWLFLRANKGYSIIHGGRWYHHVLRGSPTILFRLSLIGVFVTWAVTFIQDYQGSNPTWNDLLGVENFQALLIALLWFVGGGRSFYKLLPFMILSYMHLINKNNEFKKDSKDEDVKVTRENVKLLHLIAYSEVLVAVTLLLDAILFKTGTSGFMFVIYCCIYWLRLNFSPYAQVTLLRILSKFDKKIPPAHKHKWNTVKKFFFMRMKQHEKRKDIAKRTA
ncbi:hypothetical protein KAFR_0F03750 [Kazachstania africana CBS 2517]|uniref:Uncharacterized protein n=1 Tax=Kazachstania africana (strain ATCC 22294 / BCRC 22015 / CBS 2517 / CECT 1963 / NBRC 1671 / NRRL Y-8276) TaxID=1071382 RepID=H2AX71_KAZAF|nr:hypothetical protein KAFR_0F03750 [Kazachstania africana CBS 2517]CCF58971.1 hypothetical protein KAFR_0F03750 [Kazachstania africana CBS 2517]